MKFRALRSEDLGMPFDQLNMQAGNRIDRVNVLTQLTAQVLINRPVLIETGGDAHINGVQ